MPGSGIPQNLDLGKAPINQVIDRVRLPVFPDQVRSIWLRCRIDKIGNLFSKDLQKFIKGNSSIFKRII